MRIQELGAYETPAGKLALSWKVADETVRAVCVSVALDSEFTVTARTFFLPVVEGMQLDTGPGLWYYRVGALVGTEVDGKVDWSGIYGPLPVRSVKPVVPTGGPARLKVAHVSQIQGGVRLHTGLAEKYWVLVEVCPSGGNFKSSVTEWLYKVDLWRGHLDVDSMKDGLTYSVRVSGVAGDWSSLPGAAGVQALCDGVVVGGLKAVKPRVKIVGGDGAIIRGTVDSATRQTTGGDLTTAAADKVLLREAQNNRVQRFSSYADYMTFVQAAAKQKIGS
jgi:hypothetical protein